MSSHVSQFLAGAFFLAFLAVSGLSVAQVPEISGSAEGEKDGKERMDAWESLTPVQREKLKQALRDVWTDPAVVTARAEVKQASDVYQAAVKAAVGRADPSIADSLAKIQRANSGMANERISERHPLGLGPKRGFEEEFKPPGFLDSLPPAAREKFRLAEESALKAESVKAARAKLDEIRREDEALRSKRLEAYGTFRKALVDEIVRIDPSMAGLQEHLFEGDRNGPPPIRKKENESKGSGDDQSPTKPE